MDTDLLRKILNDNRELSSLPQTLSEVLRVARDEKSSAEQIAKVLMRDQAMTANVLRIVNSPFYGVGRNIGTVTQAVMTIGIWQVTALALSTSVYQMTTNWRSSLDRVRFWRHSLEVAIAARIIAERIRYAKVEDAFVAGLLHDIGLLVLENSFPEKFEKFWSEAAESADVLALEDEILGTNHARVGQFLLQRWFLPEQICEAVGKHHSSVAADSRQPGSTIAQIVRLAHILSKFVLVRNDSLDADWMVTREVLRANLGLSEKDVAEIECEILNRTVEESAFLEIDIGSAEEISREANELLFNQYVTVGNLLKEISKMKQQIAASQNERASWQSLQASTLLLAKHLKNTVTMVKQQTQEIRGALQKGAVHDPNGAAARSLNVIDNRFATVESIADGLTGLGTFDSLGDTEAEWAAELEERIARQQELLKESAPLS
jgi:putative nucleotidyltransferase with HDIG domain